MNKIVLIVIVFLLGIGTVAVFVAQRDDARPQQMEQETDKKVVEEREEKKPDAYVGTTSKFVYEPKPIQLPLVPTPYGGFKTYASPNGSYIAWSYSNEGGDSGIYITDLKENKLTDVYCGFFRPWSEDSKQIEVYVPVECGLPSGVNSASFYLTVEGDVINNDALPMGNEDTQEQAGQESSNQQVQLAPRYVPEGWRVYQNPKVNRSRGGIAFAYPAHWNLREGTSPLDDHKTIIGISVKGDGYDILISGAGTGLPQRNWTNPTYAINGQPAKVWQAEVGDGYELVIVVETGDFQFWITTPTREKDLLDKFLSTIVTTD